ncbi:MAG: hypothetical protein O2897_01825 [bacterium]|nr:hypothetical protein [bacterium]
MLHSSDVKFQNDSLNLNVSPKGTFKTTSNIEFSTQLRRIMSQGTAAMSNAASAAAPMVPGASVVSAVLSNAAGNLNAPDNGLNNGGLGNLNQNSNSLMNFEQMQKNMMSMNMQMISVQREFQQMSEQYTMVSNVLKTKHDAEKNAISNIR